MALEVHHRIGTERQNLLPGFPAPTQRPFGKAGSHPLTLQFYRNKSVCKSQTSVVLYLIVDVSSRTRKSQFKTPDRFIMHHFIHNLSSCNRSEERRVGKECRS